MQKQRRKGTTVKRVGNNYYLYKHSSKRVKGKKNPVPHDTYIGRITPDGVEEGKKRKDPNAGKGVVVREFGFSRALILRCPQDWKDNLPGRWEKILVHMIFEESPETYLKDSQTSPPVEDLGKAYNAQVSMLARKLYKLYGIGLREMKPLRSIYLVTVGNNRMISQISQEQQEILDKLSLVLEAP